MSVTGLTQVTAANLCDATNTKIALGTIWFAPVLNDGTPTGFRSGVSGGGQVIDAPVATSIDAGAFTIALADTSLTTPVNVGYRVWATYPNGQRILGVGYNCFQPTGATVNFDTIVPNLAPQISVQPGPPGPSGTIVSATATALSVGASPTVTIGGSPSAATLAFGIPAGATGASGTIVSATATGLSAGASPTVALGGSPSAATLAFGIPAGATGANGIASLPQLAVTRTRLPQLPNLCDPSAISAGMTITHSSYTLTAFGPYAVTGIIPANAGGQMVANFPIVNGSYGDSIFLDANDAPLSAISSAGVAAGTPFSVPSTAASIRLVFDTSAPFAAGFIQYVGNGATVPSTVLAFNKALTAAYADAIPASITAAAIATQYASMNDWLSRAFSGYNLFDLTRVTDGYYINSHNAVTAAAGNSVSDFIPLFPGKTMIANFDIGNNGSSSSLAYDANFNLIGQIPNTGPYAVTSAGTPFVVPAGMYWLKQSFPDSTVPGAMILLGSTLPSTYLAFGEAPTFLASLPKPLQGIKVAVFGDSYSAFREWQNTFVAKSGAVIAFQDVRSSRSYAGIFEDYLDDPDYTRVIGGDTTQNFPAAYGDPVSGRNVKVYGQGSDGGTVGNTLAQDLVAAGVRVCLIYLGTNDVNFTPVGSITDAPGSGSEFALINRGIQGLQAAVPGMQIMLVTNLNNQAQSVSSPTQAVTMVQTLKAVGEANGLPVLDMYGNSGINQYNWASMLRSDGLHPATATGMVRVGALIAAFVAANLGS